MRSLRSLVAVALLVFAPLSAQSTDQLLDRLRLTAAADALESPDSLPFHLKATILLEAQYHRPVRQGTVQIWSAGAGSRRITYDLPDYHATFLHTPDGDYRTPGAAPPPYLVKYLLDQALHPLPQSLDSAQYEAALQKHTFGKTDLDCITLTSLAARPPASGLAEPRKFCLDPASSDLRVTFDVYGQSTIRETVGTFRDHRVAIQLATSFTSTPVAHLHVDELKGQAAPYPELADSTGLVREKNPAAVVAGRILAGSIRTKQTPVYPTIARQKLIFGSVLLHAIIGVDGHIRYLEVIGSPDDSLTESAMNAVQNWTYSPYLLNGQPTEVDTTIVVNFNPSPRP